MHWHAQVVIIYSIWQHYGKDLYREIQQFSFFLHISLDLDCLLLCWSRSCSRVSGAVSCCGNRRVEMCWRGECQLEFVVWGYRCCTKYFQSHVWMWDLASFKSVTSPSARTVSTQSQTDRIKRKVKKKSSIFLFTILTVWITTRACQLQNNF